MRAALILPALALLAACDDAPKATFVDASITLPDDPIDLPEGPGRDAVLAHCTACHSPSTLLQQPRVSRAKWEEIAGKMIKVYKAPVDPAAIPSIADYMVHVQGQPALRPEPR